MCTSFLTPAKLFQTMAKLRHKKVNVKEYTMSKEKCKRGSIAPRLTAISFLAKCTIILQ